MGTVAVESPLIVAEGLEKSFGSTVALAGVDIAVGAGSVLGLLGPNGAGKTTLVRILATLLRPDAGSARIGGYDVVREPQAVRAQIGLAGQFAAVDESLTGFENLEMVARLYGLSRISAQTRAEEALERLGLTHAAERLVRTYSGGMRRRLDLGASLVGSPSVLIMDEPTSGLDPRTRADLWEFIEELVRGGTTLLLTTQYLEEADRLADRVAVIDNGRVIATGTADELKIRVGGDVLEVRVTQPADVDSMAALLAGVGSGDPVAHAHTRRVTVPVTDRVQSLMAAARRIGESGLSVEDLGVRRPSLDDVFLTLTGRPAADGAALEEAVPGVGRRGARA